MCLPAVAQNVCYAKPAFTAFPLTSYNMLRCLKIKTHLAVDLPIMYPIMFLTKDASEAVSCNVCELGVEASTEKAM